MDSGRDIDAEVADSMRDTLAFVKARMEKDTQGIKVLMENDPVGLIFGLTDLCISNIRMFALIVGTTPERFMEVLSQFGVMATMEMEGYGTS